MDNVHFWLMSASVAVAATAGGIAACAVAEPSVAKAGGIAACAVAEPSRKLGEKSLLEMRLVQLKGLHRSIFRQIFAQAERREGHGRENPVGNATCATERFAQVDIPTDSGTATCTGRFSDRFFAPGAAMGAVWDTLPTVSPSKCPVWHPSRLMGAVWDTLHAVLSARCPVWHPSRPMGAVCHSLQCPYLIAVLAPVFDVSARNSAYTSCHFHRGKGRCDPPS